MARCKRLQKLTLWRATDRRYASTPLILAIIRPETYAYFTALTAIKARAPVLGGNFGVWGGMFSTFDCAVKGVRKKEDPWNAIIAGFFTGGALAVRGGPRAIRNGAIGCAILLAVIEGVGIGFQRMMAENTRLELPPPPPNSTSAAGSEGRLAAA